jgi:agmatine deiminase
MIPLLRFDDIPYPIWRRRLPAPAQRIAHAIMPFFTSMDADFHPPQSIADVVQYMARWRLLPQGMNVQDAEREMARNMPMFTTVPLAATPSPLHEPIRLEAQWSPMERILLSFPVLYPPLWQTYARMIEAITPVAEVSLYLPTAAWVNAVHYYLQTYAKIEADRFQFHVLPTDDIWVRDYGPFVGHTASGARGVVDARFDPLGAYPQALDDAMAARWSAHHDLPTRRFEFHTEGGNYWADDAGTLIVSDEMEARHPDMSRAQIEEKLCEVFAYKKLIVLPRLLGEETGHIDLVCKLADSSTILINTPNGSENDARLRHATEMMRQETNAAGEAYRVLLLPFPPAYYNWGLFRIWRSYTNSLTVNGRVLVPVFGLAEDQEALAVYRIAMPDHEIIPIDCRKAANGGGAVHCLTKEIPAQRSG